LPDPLIKMPGQRRHRRPKSTVGLGRADVRRLARRAGVKRISGKVSAASVNDELRKGFLGEVVRRSVLMADRRKTVSALDILQALRSMGRPMYGADVPPPRQGPGRRAPPPAPPEDAPPEDAPPEDAPPEDAPPEDAPPEDAPPEDAPPEHQPPEHQPPEDAPPDDELPDDEPPEPPEPPRPPPRTPEQEAKSLMEATEELVELQCGALWLADGLGRTTDLTKKRDRTVVKITDVVRRLTEYGVPKGIAWAGPVVRLMSGDLVCPKLRVECAQLLNRRLSREGFRQWGPVFGGLAQDLWEILRPAMSRTLVRDLGAQDAIAAKPDRKRLNVKFVDGREGNYEQEGTRDVVTYRKRNGVGPDSIAAKFYLGGRSPSIRKKARERFDSERRAILALRQWSLVHGRNIKSTVQAAFVELEQRDAFDIGLKHVVAVGAILMQPMLAPLNALPPELQSMQAVWRIFRQLVETLDSLRPTQYWDLKSANVMVDAEHDVKLIDLEGIRTPEEMTRRLEASVPVDFHSNGEPNTAAALITTTRTPGLTASGVLDRWDLHMSPDRNKFWAVAKPHLPTTAQLDECYMWVSSWCLIQIGLVLAYQASRKKLESPLSSRHSRPNMTAKEMATKVRALLTPLGSYPLVEALRRLTDRAARFEDAKPLSTFAKMLT
jgi:histone H3/H4